MEEDVKQDTLEFAEELIELGSLDKAQAVLDNVKEKSAKKRYLQSRIYKGRFWFTEQRKQLKEAIKAEPDNELYQSELKELEDFAKTDEYKSTVKRKQMGFGEGCAELCAECSCMCCLQGLCEGICEGCG